jgi:glycosyltransferase involved in cell wall biosynthesis
MPGATNYGSNDKQLTLFMHSIDILYIRIDARFINEWPPMLKCVELASRHVIVWEINAPADESLAYSWLSGRSITKQGEGLWRRLRRWQHALRKLPGIKAEETLRKKTAQKAHAAICVSSSLGKYAEEDLGIPEVLVLPNGGQLLTKEEIDIRRNRTKQGKFTVLYSGSAMYPWQGLDYLAQVIELAKTEAPQIQFILAVNQKIQSLPISDNVVILEQLNREKIIDAICGADACVSIHPEYPWAKHGFHNSPMKLFEYMACARPAVTSNHGQMKEIIRDGVDGVLCKNEPRDILNKLKFLQQNPDQARTIGHNAWARIHQELSWRDNVVSNTLLLFQRLLESNNTEGSQ